MFAAGPPTAEQVSAFWSNLQHLHPKASIVASSLDAFAAEVLSGNTAQLQTVTEELGDSWLYISGIFFGCNIPFHLQSTS